MDEETGTESRSRARLGASWKAPSSFQASVCLSVNSRHWGSRPDLPFVDGQLRGLGQPGTSS